MSYARTDDRLPPNLQDGKGFVTCLHEQIDFEFQQLGAPWPKIWRDKRTIEPGDQFDPIIEAAINQSNIFLVVLSPNWMESDYCRHELESFARRWQQEGEMRVKQRIVVACKRFVDRERRPSLLQRQQGYDFFEFEGPGESGQQFDFFSRGAIRDKRYDTVVGGLAGFLYRRAQQLNKPPPEPTKAQIVLDTIEPTSLAAPLYPQPSPDSRKIYLAKPASDMREAYSRLVEELSHSGYAIVPDPDPKSDIPHDASAADYIDRALREADVSIHLIGDGQGYTPENSEPIVKLQISRAAARLSAAAEGTSSGSGFRRIIWAPEALGGVAETAAVNGKPTGDGSPQAPVGLTRRPDEVLSRFGDFKPSDKVVGGTLSKFVDFVIEHLRQSDSHSIEVAEPSKDDWVYVYHVPADTQYACDLMDAFKQRGIEANLPALEGAPAEVMRLHQQRLSECSAVVLCWAQATEAWAHAHAHELKDWKKLGRQKKFNYRGLLAGPPPGVRKTVFVKYPPSNEIDVVVNVTQDTRPLVEAIDRFENLAPAHAQ